LRLIFDDIEKPFFGAIHFDTVHAEAILCWLNEVEGKVDNVFVYCHAGRSRSAAVAKFIIEKYDLPGGIRVYEEHNGRVHRILTRRGRSSPSRTP
jgi:hypothetical protein